MAVLMMRCRNMATWFHDKGDDSVSQAVRASGCYLCNGALFELTEAGDAFMDLLMERIKEVMEQI